MTLELAELPDEMKRSELVRQALENKANAQVILDDLYAKLRAGEEVGERTLEAAIKLSNQVQSATHDLLAKWPKDDQERPTRRIPRSVIDWLEHVEDYSGKVQVLEPQGAPKPDRST